MRPLRILSMIVLLILAPSGAAGRFLEPVRAGRAAFEATLRDSSLDALERAETLVRIGRLDEARALLETLPDGDDIDREKAALLRIDILLIRYDFDKAAAMLDSTISIFGESDRSFRRRAKILSAREDLAALDEASAKRIDEQVASAAGRLAGGALLYRLLRYEEAKSFYEEALALAGDPEEGVAALEGLLLVAYKRNDFDGAALLGDRALEAGPPTPHLINTLASLQIRLGETREAIALSREALEWDPYNERAHYMLGNGYSDMNYTELEAAYPAAFPDDAEDESTAPTLHEAARLIAGGRRGVARALLINIRREHPDLADPDLYLGTLFWDEGESDSAITHFRASLDRCPDYGRAHNGFAKAMEQKKLRVNVHRAEYEKVFEETPMPEIEGIEDFVVNYNALTPRHRKRVALSIEPWARFIPVLVGAGATYYIKPLYEKLSETPHQELMADLRISYDSRLWDDVRGCGGFHTVTGVEDVERTIFGRYNTVLHELTHQVHSILTPEEKRLIREQYRKAKKREAEGKKTFVTRYQGSSEWEYFAEGMNSIYSPKRDEYDTREIVRERLEELDPELISLVGGLVADTSIAKYYAPAYVAAASDEIENGRLESAVAFLEKALDRSGEDEEALCALARTRSILGEDGAAVEAGGLATKSHPTAAAPWRASSEAVFHATGSQSDRIAILLKGRDAVGRDQRWEIELALGGAYLGRGDLRLARESFLWVLEYQDDNPDALWGLAEAYGFNGRPEKADALFRKALLRRSGIVELRVDYAKYLARRERLEDARAQLEEATVLDPVNTDVEAAAGLVELYSGNMEEAKKHLEEAIAHAEWNDFAVALLAHVEAVSGETDEAEKLLRPLLESVERNDPPRYVYEKKRGEYRSVHEHPAEERWMVFRTAALLASARGDEEKAKEYGILEEQAFR